MKALCKSVKLFNVTHWIKSRKSKRQMNSVCEGILKSIHFLFISLRVIETLMTFISSPLRALHGKERKEESRFTHSRLVSSRLVSSRLGNSKLHSQTTSLHHLTFLLLFVRGNMKENRKITHSFFMRLPERWVGEKKVQSQSGRRKKTFPTDETKMCYFFSKSHFS